MPRLRLKGTDRYEEIPDEALKEALATGIYEAPAADANIPVVVGDYTGSVSGKDFDVYTDKQGARPETEDEFRARERMTRIEREQGGVLGGTKAFVGSALNEATFGASTFLGEKVLGEGFREGLAEASELHSELATAGGLTGVVAPALLSGGAGAVGTIARSTGAGAAARVGSRIAALGAERGVIGKAVAHAAGGAVEGALMNSGHIMAEAVLHNKELSSEAFVAAAEEGGLWGGIGGGGLSLLGSGARGAVRKVDGLIKRDADLVATAKAQKESSKAVATAEKKLEAAKKADLAHSRKLELVDKRTQGQLDVVDARTAGRKDILETTGEVKKGVSLAKAEAEVAVARARHAERSELLAVEQERTLRAKTIGECGVDGGF